MRHKKLHLFIGTICLGCNVASAQLFIDQATFTIQSGATVTVQGDVTSNTDILGTGKVILKGTANQNINLGGFTVPNLEIDNASNVTLTGNAKIGSSLQFTNGKIFLGANNLTLTTAATTTGAGTSKFVETNGNGQLLKELTANATAFEMPVGVGSAYRPAFVTTSGTYSSANVGIKVLAGSHPNKPTSISDFVAAYWPVTRTGITGTLTVAGQYTDPTDVTGTESNLRGYFYNGSEWSSASGTNDAALNRVGAPVAANGTVYGMDKFIYVKAKAILQGAFNTVTGVMSDALRSAIAPSNFSVIPLTDPYRTTPYNVNFTHVNNPINESASASVFADQASTDNNIVDWVFVELRNNIVSPGNLVLQTRSALLTRTGNIVDVDGINPITFNNTVNGNYTVAIRHRNHLGISANPATNLYAGAEARVASPLLDLTTATSGQIYQNPAPTAGVGYIVLAGKNAMWGGNANMNSTIRWNPSQSDKDFILASPLILNGVSSTVLSNVYNVGDVNFDRRVRWNPSNSDKDYILGSVLSAVSSTIRSQSLPN